MENLRGYSRIMADHMVHREQNKPLFRKPFLKYGQCFALAGYFFQLGAILAAKHRGNLDAFGHSFLGLYGEPGTIKSFFAAADEDQMGFVHEPMDFADYVGAEQIKRFNFPDDDHYKLLYAMGMRRIRLDAAAEMAWQFAEQGAIMGAMHPDIARRMFDHTHRPRSQEDWDRARAAGIDIPAQQDLECYEEVEADENRGFMAYCQQCCSDLYAVLIA